VAQTKTVPTTIEEIMSAPAFALGAIDARAGAPFHPDFNDWHKKDQWHYERGRNWATLAPKTVPLRETNGKLSAKAVAWYRRHKDDIL
jgi:hypothetical protein